MTLRHLGLSTFALLCLTSSSFATPSSKDKTTLTRTHRTVRRGSLVGPGALHQNMFMRAVGPARTFQPPQITSKPGGVDSISKAITHIWVTHEYTSDFPQLVTTNADVGKADSDDMKAFRLDTKTANANKFHDNDHYEFRDPRITAELIAMKASGFGGVSIHTDFANIFELGPTDVTTSDFNRLMSEGKFKKDSKGNDIDAVVEFKKLIQAGFELVGSDNKLSNHASDPAYRYTLSGPSVIKLEPQQEGVIFHLKRYMNYIKMNGVVHYRNVRSGEVNYSLAPNVTFDSQGFATPHSRLNITYEFSDPNILEEFVADHQAEIPVFGDGGTVAQVPALPVTQWTYPDGKITIVNLKDYSGEHPNDRFNPNSYITDMIKDAIYTYKTVNKIPLDPDYDRPPVDPSTTVSIEEIQMMAYVFTDKDLLEALNRLFSLKTGTKGTFHFEQQFADADGPGYAALFGGFALNRDMGGLLQDVDGILSNNPNIQSTVNQRWIEGTTAPYLNHGKFILLRVTINGKKKIYIHDLSFNISGHTANAENRMIVEADVDTPLAQESLTRLQKIIDLDKKQGFAVDMHYGEFRSFLARLTGKDLQNISLTDSNAIFDALNSAQNKTSGEVTKIYNDFINNVRKIYSQPTKSILEPAIFDGRMKNIQGFNTFAITQLGKGKSAGYTVQKYVAGIDSIAYKNEKLDERRGDLRITFASKPISQMTPAELAALDAIVDAAAKAEGQTEPLPPLPLTGAIQKELPVKDNFKGAPLFSKTALQAAHPHLCPKIMGTSLRKKSSPKSRN